MFVRKTLKAWLGLVVGRAMYSGIRLLAKSLDSEWTSARHFGPVEELQPGTSTTVQLRGRCILVTRSRDRRARAVNAICTNMRCLVRLDLIVRAGNLPAIVMRADWHSAEKTLAARQLDHRWNITWRLRQGG